MLIQKEVRMNEVLEVIKRRRSIRNFSDKAVSKADLEVLIEAGLSAPTAVNSQARQFTVIQKRELIEKLNCWIDEVVVKSQDPHMADVKKWSGGRYFNNAPILIVVSVPKDDRWGRVNAAIATQNIVLAAESLGISSCWNGMIVAIGMGPRTEECAKELSLIEGYTVANALALGYGASEPPSAPERKQRLVTYVS
jgi:nitroreductase